MKRGRTFCQRVDREGYGEQKMKTASQNRQNCSIGEVGKQNCFQILSKDILAFLVDFDAIASVFMAHFCENGNKVLLWRHCK